MLLRLPVGDRLAAGDRDRLLTGDRDRDRDRLLAGDRLRDRRRPAGDGEGRRLLPGEGDRFRRGGERERRLADGDGDPRL